MTVLDQLKLKLREYTSGRLTFDEFRTWFAPVLRDVHKFGDADAEKFAHAIEWEFCDLERGLQASEKDLKQSLVRLNSATIAEENPPEVGNPDVQVFRQEVVLQPKGHVVAAVTGNSGCWNTTLVVAQTPQNVSSESLVTFSVSDQQAIPAA